MWYYCDIYDTVNKAGSDVSAGLVIPQVEDMYMCSKC